MHNLGFVTCPADLDIWMKPMIRPDDGFNYYAYILIYVDDVMVIHRDVESVLRRIDKYFKLNHSSIDDPDIYLGPKLNKIRLENGVWAWTNRPARYIKESLANVEKYLAELADVCWQLPKKKSENTFVGDYAMEMDETPALDQELASWYQYLIGVLRCMVEIGIVDIITKV